MRTEPRPRSRAFPSRPGQAALVIIAFTSVLYVVELFDSMFGDALQEQGIDPRSIDGLDGVLWAPLLHGPLSHLVSNTVPVLVLGFLVLANGVRQFAGVTAVVWLVGGAGTWLFGGGVGGGVHIGASILVFGWMLFLLARGFYTRSAGQITLGVTLFLFWGGLLWGVLPTTPGVSWEGHLFGAIGGLIAAHFIDRTDRSPIR